MTQQEDKVALKITQGTLDNKVKDHRLRAVKSTFVFTESEVNILIGYIREMNENGILIDETGLKFIIKSYLDRESKHIRFFSNNLPDQSWIDHFLKFNKSLSVLLKSNFKRSMAFLDDDILTEYINNLKTTLSGVDPQNIFNYDETNLTNNPRHKNVLIKRGSKYPKQTCNTSKVSFSIMMCGNAVGDILPLYVVYKAKDLWKNWTEHGPEGCRYNVTTSGWFDDHTFTDWFENILLCHFKNKVGKKVVIGDNLSSHLTPEIIEKCKKDDIYFVCIPPNCIHLTQPLDVALFHPMKVAWRKILGESTGSTNSILQKQSFPKLLKKLLIVLKPTLKTELKHGFRKCGIFPYGVEELLRQYNMILKSNVDEASYIEDLNVKRSATIKRKKNKVPAETSNSDIDDYLADIDTSASEKDIQNITNIESSSVSEVDDCPVSSDGKYAVEDFVIVNYLNTMYPGIITSINSQGAIVNSMKKSKTFYKWPVKQDKMFYKWTDILMKIKPPQPMRRGFFNVEELNEYTS